jgi:hypothetical protein
VLARERRIHLDVDHFDAELVLDVLAANLLEVGARLAAQVPGARDVQLQQPVFRACSHRPENKGKSPAHQSSEVGVLEGLGDQ